MARTLLSLAIFATQLAILQVCHGRSPDELPNSPIPPLKDPSQVANSRSAEERSLFPISPTKPSALLGISAPRPPQTTRPSLQGTASPQARQQSAENPVAPIQGYETERSEIWNSREMSEARYAVLQFSRRSVQTSYQEGQEFLDRLSRLPPEEMRNWLARYEARRINALLQRDVEQLARRLMLDKAISRQEAMRQAAENVKQLRSQQMAGEGSYLTHDQHARQMRILRMLEREGAVVSFGPLSHDPMDATADPMNPRGYARRVAGAMTLPGDLPRDDPRNYDRHAADYGEWATTRDAEPPIPEIPGPEAAPVEVPAE